MFPGKGVFKTFAKFATKHLPLSLLFSKVTGRKAENLSKRNFSAGAFL